MTEEVEKFLTWFNKLGGTEPANIKHLTEQNFKPLPDPTSSFKNRALEIKRKYNHKFRLKSIHDIFLDTNNIYFEQNG